ncbi:protein kinase domain-containing protein [Photobacterium kasasachensis]|uniref:protein kinase domain-containing protein n=1 Tax=Photobacterium kasasachensis TaxID=2910240 RepID=UPI003D142F83
MADTPSLCLGNVLLERYILVEVLNERVFVANDDRSGRKVIVKCAEKAQIERESLCMNHCRSPYTARPIETLPNILILPYVSGKSVLTFSSDQIHLFMSLIPKIVRAIEYVHQSGWVHGDIKPSNVLYLSHLDSINLIDYGAAWPIGTPLSRLSEWQLTPGFSRSSKEMGIGSVESADDWYALAKWLKQIDASSLSVRNRLQLARWQDWLKENYV